MEPTNQASESLRSRELDVAREVAYAFMSAATPLEVYRLALARLTPLVCARFSSVFQPDPEDATLLKLTCAHNWPQASARWLGMMRLRLGRGPTGRAAAERRLVQVHDVFADPALREWWDPARELGFVSLISLPLQHRDGGIGALTFYFDAPHDADDDERHLLMLIADQISLAAQRAEAQEALHREAERLRAENERLRSAVGAGEEARRMKDEFLSNISHELRTPLTSILGYAQLLAEGQAGPLEPPQRTAVERIDSAANALLRLISDLLDLTQLRLGRTRVEVAPDDAVLIARRALHAVGEPPDGVHVRVETAADRIPLHTDGALVQKVLENLLGNAFKFTQSGTIVLRVDRHPAHVEWTVADTGIGIPADQHEAVFDEFRQVDGSSTRLYGGTGLGLALSRGLAAVLGGRIRLDSVPGEGATFRLTLPGTE